MRAPELLAALEQEAGNLAEISFVSIHSVFPREGDVENALHGVFRLGDQLLRLEPPVDWAAGPYSDSLSRAFVQNSLVFADTLLADSRRAEVLDLLARLFADWVLAHPRDREPNPHQYAWHDHAAAARLVYISFLLREAVRLGSLDPEARLLLAQAVLEHADFIIVEYVPTHNHGLYSDAALALAARSLDPVEPSARWKELAQERFADVLDRTVDRDEGVHLEHSPAYQSSIRRALERFAGAGLFRQLDLPQLVGRMRECEAWILTPDGHLPPIGDTSDGILAPPEIRERARALHGLQAFRRAGYVAVRHKASMLLVTAAYHPTAHKHADDGSFCLYENGRPLITDSGDPGYDYKGPDRRYGTSPAAHSNVAINEFDWVRAGGSAYGSGVVAAEIVADGTYAVLVENPLAVKQGGGARRLLVYRPAAWLVVVDAVAAGPEARVSRRLQLASELDAVVNQGALEAVLWDDDEVVARLVFADSAFGERLERIRGQEEPTLAGFAYPSVSTRVPRITILAQGVGPDPRAFTLGLGADPILPKVLPGADPEFVWAGIAAPGEPLLWVGGSSERIEVASLP